MGVDTIALSTGDPDFATPQPIVDAMTEALTDGYTHYVPAAGLPELRERLASEVSALAQHQIEPSNVLITHGGSAGITSTVLACVNPGQAVVVADPTYSLYADAVALAGGRLISVPMQPGNETDDLTRLGDVAREASAALVVICNPVNPTGGVIGRGALRSLAKALDGTDCLVLSDEAYKDICYSEDFSSALEVPELQERLIYCQTFSKTFAMTGWRLGYVVARASIISAASLVHKTMTGPLNAATQRAAIVALETQQQTVPKMIEHYRNRRQMVIDALAGVPGISLITPAATFYVWIKYDFNMSAEDLRVVLEDRYGVAVRAGSEYGDGGEGYIRLSFAYSEATLRQGLKALHQAFSELNAPYAKSSTSQV